MLTQGTTLSHIITLVKSAQVAVRSCLYCALLRLRQSTSAPVIETYLSGSAATPGSTLPSMNSSDAPPPDDTCVILSDKSQAPKPPLP